jgi:putative ABC transport system permease protein
VFPGAVTVGGAKQGAGAISLITQSDAAVVRAVPELEFVSEIVTSQQQVISSLTNWRTSIVGVNVDYQNIKNWPMKSGAFFTDADVTAVTKVCVLGSNVAETLFEDEDPTGQELRIRNHVFKVLGVMAPKGASSSGTNQDDQIFAPYTTVMKKLQGNDFLSYILASAKSAGDIAYSSQLITEAMRTAHNIESGTDDNFRVLTQDDLIAARTQATQTMTSLLAGIAAVSLLVGGIGIMNIMLVSVTERTREIGLRLAIGASGGDVLMQFLIEAVVISLAGGFIGIALGYGLSGFLNAYENMTTLVPSNAAFIAVAFSASVGIFFGFYPARKAAALDPIDALRFE